MTLDSNMKNRTVPRLSLLSLFFLSAVFVPLVVMLAQGTMSTPHARDPFPGLPRKAGDVPRFPGRFRAAFNAHFGLRDALVRLHGRLLYDGLGVSPNPSLVVLGSDDWLFLNDESMDEYRHINPFSAEELDSWADVLESEAQRFRSAGVAHLFVIVPDKHTIHGEAHIPTTYRRRVGPSRLDQLLDYLATENRDVEVVDLRPALREGVETFGTVYYESDSHWNAIGAAIGSGAILDALAEQGVATEPLTISARPEDSTFVEGGDEARLIGIKASYRQQFPRPEVRIGGRTVDLALPSNNRVEVNGAPMSFSNTNNQAPPDAPVILYIHDSTGVSVRPYLAEASSRLEARWTNRFESSMLDELAPTVVIHQLIERRLHNLDPAELLESP